MPPSPMLPKAQPSLWLSLDGRITRGTFVLYFYLPLLVLRLLTMVLDGSSEGVGPITIREAISSAFGEGAVVFTPFAGPVTAVGVVLLIWPAVVGVVKRLHDLNLSGWLYPGYLAAGWGSVGIWLTFPESGVAKVPLALMVMAALWFAGFLSCVDGTRGPNGYGPDPLGRPESVEP